jgi:DNA-binding NtrC family response regulator
MKGEEKLFLIVDDESDMCWALEHLLKKEGMPSIRALNGEEALTLMEENRVELVFLDAKLPDIEGLELARQIREIDPHIPIVMITGYFYRDDTKVKEALSEGLISMFITKPFNHSEVLRTVESLRPS